MCTDQEHRFFIYYSVDSDATASRRLAVYAHNIHEAFAKADGILHREFPGKWINFSISRAPYCNNEVAREHGAIT